MHSSVCVLYAVKGANGFVQNPAVFEPRLLNQQLQLIQNNIKCLASLREIKLFKTCWYFTVQQISASLRGHVIFVKVLSTIVEINVKIYFRKHCSPLDKYPLLWWSIMSMCLLWLYMWRFMRAYWDKDDYWGHLDPQKKKPHTLLNTVVLLASIYTLWPSF